MSKEKTEILRSQIQDLIVEAIEQEISFGNLKKMLEEEIQKTRKEQLEQRAKRSEGEILFKQKAEKMLDRLKEEIRYSTGYYPQMLKNSRQRRNCIEVLCVFYSKGSEDINQLYIELETRLQLKKETIYRSLTMLCKFIARYYGYDNFFQFEENHELKKEKLQDFMTEIENE